MNRYDYFAAREPHQFDGVLDEELTRATGRGGLFCRVCGNRQGSPIHDGHRGDSPIPNEERLAAWKEAATSW